MSDNTDVSHGHNFDSNIGTPTFVEGKFGMGGNLDATSIFHTYSDLGWDSSSTTISFWVKPAAATGTRSLFSLYTKNTNHMITGRWANAISGYVFEHYGVVTDQIYSNANVFSTSSYTNFLVTYDNTTFSLYINGALDKDMLSPNGTFPVQIDTTSSFIVGRFLNTTSQFCPGIYDEIVVDKNAWSASKVREYYNMAIGRLTPKCP
jgi:hypothetical protein